MDSDNDSEAPQKRRRFEVNMRYYLNFLAGIKDYFVWFLLQVWHLAVWRDSKPHTSPCTIDWRQSRCPEGFANVFAKCKTTTWNIQYSYFIMEKNMFLIDPFNVVFSFQRISVDNVFNLKIIDSFDMLLRKHHNQKKFKKFQFACRVLEGDFQYI